MIKVDHSLVSEDIAEKLFACNIEACKGACCIEGDAGAPLEEGEAEIIHQNIQDIKEEMDADGLDSLERQGVSELDPFDEPVTTCKPNGECTFAITRNGSLACAIELANQKKQFGFKKPISCHLYPIRIRKYAEYYALNYHKWDICNPACDRGQEEGIKVFEFAKDALVRKFGDDWYALLQERVEEYLDSQA